MCFTIEVHLTRKSIEKRFSVDTSALYDFDFNYFYRAFSNPSIPVIAGNGTDKARLMQWGLIPSWAKDRQKAEKIRKGTYNARAESLHEKPSFREPLLRGRCLVLAHGFFEWQHVMGAKIPWYIRLKNNAPFAFAGLYDSWHDPDEGQTIHSCSIITTGANPLMERIHNTKKRMPVILTPGGEKEWITGDISLHKARQLLLPLDENEMYAHTISHSISKNDADPSDPAIIKPFDSQEPGTLF
ncbi:MAG: SOS response-associated peptidase [Bacteroidetes bacterium]|nr:SOS response-associated peptidase [Bacteroidota bacterium]